MERNALIAAACGDTPGSPNVFAPVIPMDRVEPTPPAEREALIVC